MEANPILFRDLVFIFLAAMAGGFLAWRMKLPLIIGFVLGGIVISPFTPGLKLSDLHTFAVLAEAGVVLLMFSIGVEFSIPDLIRVKWVATLGGSLGICLSITLAVFVSRLAGWTIMQGVIIGATVSVASTMVLARMLAERDAMSTTYGRVKIGITLFEDLAVVMMTVVLPVFAGSGENRWSQVAWTLGKAVVLLVPLVFLAIKIIPRILRKVKQQNNDELLLLVTLAICLGMAWLAEEVGFSVAMGAFIAGLSISGSEDLHAAHDRLIPLRDAFVALFFVSLGALIQPDVLRHSLPLLGLMLLLIIPGKMLIWTLVIRLFGYPIWVAIAAASGLTQIGELSFVIVQTATDEKMVSEQVFVVTLAASLVSIFLNVFIVRGVLGWLERKHKLH